VSESAEIGDHVVCGGCGATVPLVKDFVTRRHLTLNTSASMPRAERVCPKSRTADWRTIMEDFAR
jgi:hypothetical protein